MANAHTLKRRRVSDISSAASRVRKLACDTPLPWDKIAPRPVAEWLDVYAQANNTSRDILLASILPTIASLMGPTAIKVDCKMRQEQVNLFVICLSPPGSGKSPAFQNGCSQPIRLHVEEQSKNPIFVDEFTEVGLFRQLKSSSGNKAIIGKEEVSQFFEQILGVKEKCKLDVERLIQLYDGATWVYTKGDKSARQVIQNPGVSIVGYSQPERFYPIYTRLKERRDGAIDRMLIYQPKPKRLTAAQTKTFITQLRQSPVKDLRLIYESIYNFCHDENDIVSLTLDVDGNTAYEAFLDKITETLNKQWEDQQECVDVSKDDRHVLRLAAVLHVFYDQLQKGLTNQPTSPPQALVKKETLEQAIHLTRYFAEHRKILDQLGSDDHGTCRDDSSIASTILSSFGPFVTVRIAQSSFSGSKRPTASTVVEVMMNLEKDGLGKVKTVDTTTVFYKCLPCNIVETSIQNYKLSREDYRGKFTERADRKHLSKDLFNKLLDKAPNKHDLETVYSITSEED